MSFFCFVMLWKKWPPSGLGGHGAFTNSASQCFFLSYGCYYNIVKIILCVTNLPGRYSMLPSILPYIVFTRWS